MKNGIEENYVCIYVFVFLTVIPKNKYIANLNHFTGTFYQKFLKSYLYILGELRSNNTEFVTRIALLSF